MFLIFAFFDSLQFLGANVLKGTGQQGKGAIFTSVAYLLVGVPMAYFFTFHAGMGLSGIWLGPTHANVFLAICYNVFISNIDWKALILEAKERVKLET